MTNKKYWYIVENVQDAVSLLKEKAVTFSWGGIHNLPSVTHPESGKYLIVVDWSTGGTLEDKRLFDSHPHVIPLPHNHSRVPVSNDTLQMLKDCTKDSGEYAITNSDHTHDIIIKLSGHTGWNGWWKHL